MSFIFFFFNDTATTEIYTLSLHDALPIFLDARAVARLQQHLHVVPGPGGEPLGLEQDRKSTRLNSSHSQISYAVFCLKKKKIKKHRDDTKRYKDNRSVYSSIITTSNTYNV